LPASPPSPADAAAALLAAYSAKHGAPPPSDEAIVLPLAQAMGEGSLSSYFAGTNNFGAMHATSGFARTHAADPGYGMVAFLDHAPGGGAYVTRMSVYPSLAAGARGYLDLVESMATLSQVGSSADFAQTLYAHGWFEGMAAPATPIASRPAALASGAWTSADLQNIADYAAAIDRNVPAATAGLAAAKAGQAADPTAPSSGDFAPLADRLTPAAAYAPHTLEHARALLGAAADSPPPGGISIADAMNAPGGDGAWIFAPSANASSPASSSTTPWTVFALVAIAAATFALGVEHVARLGRAVSVR
jgi:hypothetical protein